MGGKHLIYGSLVVLFPAADLAVSGDVLYATVEEFDPFSRDAGEDSDSSVYQVGLTFVLRIFF